MKIVAIDIKATHCDSEVATILEFAAVGFDISEVFEPTHFHARFLPKKGFEADLKSIIDNIGLLNDLKSYENNEFITGTEVYNHSTLGSLFSDFYNWAMISELVYANGRNSARPYHVNVTGIDFITEKLPLLINNDYEWKGFVNPKVIDVNTLYLTSMDIEIPQFEVCKIRAQYVTPIRESYETALDKATDIAYLTHLKLSPNKTK